jgi:hypothetical protein
MASPAKDITHDEPMPELWRRSGLIPVSEKESDEAGFVPVSAAARALHI